MPAVTLSKSLITFPARVSLAASLLLIFVGTIALNLPGSTAPGKPLTWTDSAFTATSAVCVTGLVVRSTEHDFTRQGQVILIILIQLGGIGIMTVTTFIMVSWSRNQSLWQRQLVSETAGAELRSNLLGILGHVFVATVICEGIGVALLFFHNQSEWAWQQSLWHAIFHSVSAFCNAGFALHDDSLTRYQLDPLVNVTIAGLVIVGGLGFPVLLDMRSTWRRGWRRADWWVHLQLHTKLMLTGTAVLLLIGTISMLLLEWDGVLKPVPYAQRPMVAMFHSMTCRTAGFNTVDLKQMTGAMLLLSVLLMMIGAGPCSTGGGFKVSTITILFLHARSTFRGHRRLFVFGRWIPSDTVNRAVATAMIFAVLAIVALTGLLIAEQMARGSAASKHMFLGVLFEVVSALGTVGLSTGLTQELTTAGRWVIIVLMLMGRLGPISVFTALSGEADDRPIEYPQESPLVG